MAMTGLDLKLARTAARVKQYQLAAEMGVSPSRVASLEREGVVSYDAAARYLAALRTCGTRTSSTDVPADGVHPEPEAA